MLNIDFLNFFSFWLRLMCMCKQYFGILFVHLHSFYINEMIEILYPWTSSKVEFSECTRRSLTCFWYQHSFHSCVGKLFFFLARRFISLFFCFVLFFSFSVNQPQQTNKKWIEGTVIKNKIINSLIFNINLNEADFLRLYINSHPIRFFVIVFLFCFHSILTLSVFSLYNVHRTLFHFIEMNIEIWFSNLSEEWKKKRFIRFSDISMNYWR